MQQDENYIFTCRPISNTELRDYVQTYKIRQYKKPKKHYDDSNIDNTHSDDDDGDDGDDNNDINWPKKILLPLLLNSKRYSVMY